ncbi:hypothetical protein MGLY_21010 [Neomoorella glycerini]|uniref:Uncharacterized protein n=1 Tax=Neomoorella glycerini TaxID=55779 RepID=A0A6I5ZRU3_9FIRM|nr:hypothetical protein [Moorella glycerini]QGP92712.1 hypothetical protein MGLY_21010 [Moorella glycerini]
MVSFLSIDEELGLTKQDRTSEGMILNKIWQNVCDIEVLITERLNSLEGEFEKAQKNGNVLMPCPSCRQLALIIPENKCLFCYYSGPAEKIADKYISEVLGISHYEKIKEGIQWPQHDCPSCEIESLVDMGKHNKDFRYFCFSCGGKWRDDELKFCIECGRLFEDNKLCICNSCYDYKVNSD